MIYTDNKNPIKGFERLVCKPNINSVKLIGEKLSYEDERISFKDQKKIKDGEFPLETSSNVHKFKVMELI